MRWRIAIAVLVVVGIAGAVYVGTQPRKGTVEWHQRQYLKAGRQPLRIHAKNFWHYVCGKPDRWSSSELMSYEDRERHRRALIKLGYLSEHEFVVSNQPIDSVMYQTGQLCVKDPRWRNVRKEFADMDNRGTNVVIIVARPEDMAFISNAIRRADMPKNK